MMNFTRTQAVRTCLAGALMTLGVYAAPTMAHEYRAGDIEILHPYAPPTPPGAPMAAGYFEIVNHGTEDERLLGGSVTFAAELQLHETTVEGDVSRMRQMTEGVLVPAGTTVTFEPMGKHVMFTGLANPLVDGERMPATLSFESAGELAIEFAVEHAEVGAKEHEEMDHEKMDHGNMKHGEMEQDKEGDHAKH